LCGRDAAEDRAEANFAHAHKLKARDVRRVPGKKEEPGGLAVAPATRASAGWRRTDLEGHSLCRRDAPQGTALDAAKSKLCTRLREAANQIRYWTRQPRQEWRNAEKTRQRTGKPPQLSQWRSRRLSVR